MRHQYKAPEARWSFSLSALALLPGLCGLASTVSVDVRAEKLEAKLRERESETAAQVRERVAEATDLADLDVLDLVCSREREQAVLLVCVTRFAH